MKIDNLMSEMWQDADVDVSNYAVMSFNNIFV